MPNTVILDNGWQMTPQAEQCMLTHHPDRAEQDLAVIAPRNRDQVVLGVILPAKGAFTAPVQLNVIAQADEARQIGRVTFNPTTGGLGTLLMANWPADRLLPRLQQATGLNFYAPDGRLVRSVRLAGSVAAIDALNRCRGVADSSRAASAAPTPTRAIDVGWVPEFDDQACSIKRMTAKGNELDLFYGRGEGMVLVYRVIRGPRPAPGSKLSAQLSLWRIASENAAITDQDNLPAVEMKMSAEGQAPLLFGPLPAGLIDKLRSDHWTTIGFGTANSGPVDIADIVHTEGSAAAIADWRKCIGRLRR